MSRSFVATAPGERTDLSGVRFDPELTPGARNAVRVCLNVRPHEKVTVITDTATQAIAASLVHELQQVGASFRAYVLEELAPRPLNDFPAEIASDMKPAT